MVPENEISLLEQDQSSGNQVKQQVISSSSGKKVVQICRVRYGLLACRGYTIYKQNDV